LPSVIRNGLTYSWMRLRTSFLEMSFGMARLPFRGCLV
jgi:hypothetical protein